MLYIPETQKSLYLSSLRLVLDLPCCNFYVCHVPIKHPVRAVYITLLAAVSGCTSLIREHLSTSNRIQQETGNRILERSIQ